MTNEELVKQLSSISGIKETVLDNFKYANEISKIAEEAQNQYKIYYDTLSRSIALQELQDSYKSLLAPTLPAELTKLSSQYTRMEQWREELDKLNEVAKISQLPNMEIVESLLKQEKELSNIRGWNNIANQHILSGIDVSINTPRISTDTENENIEEENNQMSNIKINKISLSNFRFYNGFNKNNIFEPNGKNMLIYGENGSGKSSLFKAFDFLSKTKINEIEFEENKNIFDNDTDTFLEFEFDNDDTLKIEKDNLELTDDYNYIKNLSIFKPILDYKNLLKVHYQTDKSKEEVNIYDMLKELFKDYPIEDGKVLSNIENPKDYFDKLEEIINDKFFDDINSYLEVFDDDFKIDKFHFDMSFTDDGKVEFIVNLKIDFNDNPLHKYHLFLNEAKLTSLAISIYFSIIKNIADLLDNNSLKILILDDLLISLDMSNRLNLIDLIQQYFTDFQIFFFTHDKGLFETFKDRMEWKSYEIYVDKSDEGFEIPFVKKSQSLLEQSKYQKLHKNFDCSANLLRQCTEKLMCKFLPSDKLVSKNCKNLDLCALIDNGISFENNKENTDQGIVDMLTSLQTYRQILFNIGSHYDDTNIYKRELQEAIDILEDLKEKI